MSHWSLHSALGAVLAGDDDAASRFRLFLDSSDDLTALGNLFIKHFAECLGLDTVQAACYEGQLPPVIADALRWAASRVSDALTSIMDPQASRRGDRVMKPSHPTQPARRSGAGGVDQ